MNFPKKPDSETSSFLIANIVTEPIFQTRAKIEQDMVDRYVQCLSDLPPITLALVDKTYYLADGWHRLAAFKECNMGSIPAHIYTFSTKDEAVLFACAQNHKHGLCRNNADIRRAATVAIATAPDLDSRALGDIAGCSHTLINNIKADLKKGVEEREAEKAVLKAERDAEKADRKAKKEANQKREPDNSVPEEEDEPEAKPESGPEFKDIGELSPATTVSDLVNELTDSMADGVRGRVERFGQTFTVVTTQD